MPRIVRLSDLEQFTAINVLSDPGHIGGPVVVPSCVQVVLNWGQSSGKTAHNVLYGRAGGIPAPTVAQAQAIFAALSTGAQWTALAAFMPIGTTFTGVTLRNVHTANNPLISSTGAAVPGTGAGAALPNEVGLAITLRTALAGPQNRGRFYIPGFSVDALGSSNTVVAGLVTASANWANTITSALSAQGYTWVIGQPARAQYTGSTGTVHPARAATSVPVATAICRDNHWDSQRRRGLK